MRGGRDRRGVTEQHEVAKLVHDVRVNEEPFEQKMSSSIPYQQVLQQHPSLARNLYANYVESRAVTEVVAAPDARGLTEGSRELTLERAG